MRQPCFPFSFISYVFIFRNFPPIKYGKKLLVVVCAWGWEFQFCGKSNLSFPFACVLARIHQGNVFNWKSTFQSNIKVFHIHIYFFSNQLFNEKRLDTHHLLFSITNPSNENKQSESRMDFILRHQPSHDVFHYRKTPFMFEKQIKENYWTDSDEKQMNSMRESNLSTIFFFVILFPNKILREWISSKGEKKLSPWVNCVFVTMKRSFSFVFFFPNYF